MSKWIIVLAFGFILWMFWKKAQASAPTEQGE